MFNLRKNQEVKVEIINDSKQKVELEYPLEWSYKLISLDKALIQKVVHEVILEREHKLSHSNASKTGKFVSMNLDLLVHNEDDRNFIFDALKAHQDIKMVL